MNWKMAKTNWVNFIRMAVGLPKQYPVKVVRSEKAKQYPLIEIKKDGDVGYDLPAIERVIIPAPTADQRREYLRYIHMGEHDKAIQCLPKAIVPTGIRLEMMNNVWCSIEARSSASNKMLITPDAIIDSGYRGELFVVIYNFGFTEYVIEPGERVAQVIFHERVTAKIIETDKLSDSERGTTGFGSTGE